MKTLNFFGKMTNTTAVMRLLAIIAVLYGQTSFACTFDQVVRADIVSTTLSSANIDGSNNGSNQIPVGTLVGYKTHTGLYGKMEILSYGYNLTVQWVTYNSDGSVFHNSTNTVISGTWSYNMDDGSTSAPTDFQWNQIDSTIRYITPQNGATFGLITSCSSLASEPTTQASALTFIPYSNSITLNWTNPSSGGGTSRIVLMKQGSAVDSDPVDGTGWLTPSGAFTVGLQIGTGNYVVYNGAGNTITVTNLTPLTTYYLAVYEYNGSGGAENYLTTSPATGGVYTLAAEPTAQASAVTFSAITTNSMTVSWTNSGNGANRIVMMRAGGAGTSDPLDGTTYTANSVFGIPPASTIGVGYVIYQGTGNSVNVTGLTPGTVYYVKVYDFNGSGGNENYLITSPATNNAYTLAAEPTTQASGVNFTAITTTSMTVNWTRGNVADTGVLVLMKSGSPVDSDPVDGTGYVPNPAFGSGTQIGTGNYSIYRNNGGSVTVTNLSPGTTYYVAVYEYNDSVGAQNYLTTSPATGSRMTLSAPVITGQSALSTNEDTALTINLSDLTVTDVDNPYPTGFSLTVQSGSNYTFSGAVITPAANFNGTLTVPVKVNDGGGSGLDSNVYNLSVTVNPLNDPPVNTTLPSISGTIKVGQALSANMGVWNDTIDTAVSGSSTISYSYSQWQRADDAIGTNVADIVGQNTSSYTLTSADAHKYIRIKVDAYDSGVGSPASQSAIAYSAYYQVLNSSPVIAQGASVSVNMSEDGNPTAFTQPTISATDADGDTLTWSLNTAASNGTATVSGTGTSPTITYAPTANYNGSDSFVVQVSDGNGGTALITVNVTITAVNDAPSFTKGLDQTVSENAAAQTVANWATAISKGGGTDESTQTLTFTVTNDNNALFSVQPAIDSTGALTYTPAPSKNGAATVTVTLSDNGGGTDTSASQTFTITVSSVNDAPSFTKGADQTVNEDSGVQSVSAWATAISPGPANESSQVLTFNVTNTNNALFSAQPAISATGTLTYTPAANMNGSATVTVTLQDDGGTANGGVDTSPAQTFTITVNPLNDPPVNTTLPSISGSFAVGNTVTASPGVWDDTIDTSVSGTSNITYVYQWQRADDASGTNVSDISGETNTSYTLTSADAAKYIRIKVTATDNGVGTPATQSVTLYSSYQAVTVTAPTIDQGASVSVTMDEDATPTAFVQPTITSPVIAGITLTWTLGTAAGHGTATVSGTGASPTITYVPAADYNGTDSFTVKVSDTYGGSASISVNIAINPMNDALVNTVLPSITGTMLAGQTITANPGTWNDNRDTSVSGTSNITYAYQWQRADDLSGTNVADIGGATSGTYTLTGADKIVRVKITASDSGVGTPATQSLVVYSPYSAINNTAPVIAQGASVSVTMDENGSPIAWAAPTVSATDVDNDTLTWSVRVPPANGTVVVSGTGASPTTFTYAPKTDYNGSDSFIVQVSDGKGGMAAITVNLTINSINTPPTADAGKDQTVKPGAKVMLDGSASKDVDGAIVLYTWTQTGGSPVILSDAKAVQPSFTAPDTADILTFKLTVKDNEGAEAVSSVVTITVLVPDPPTASFSASPLTGKIPLKVQFTDTSQGSITKWEWDFGDGTQSIEQNPLHQYITSGTFTVSLKLTGPGGAVTETKSNFLTIESAPLSVDFEANPITGFAPLTVEFNSVILGNVKEVLWDFGDNQNSELPNPFHVYEKPGKYTVSVTISGPEGSKTETKADLIIAKGRSISGVVTGEDTNRGVADYQVEVWQGETVIAQTTTDDNGRYSIKDLPALDNLIVNVAPKGVGKYYSQFYSGKKWAADAERLSVMNGDVTGIDFVLKKLPTTGLKGRVHDGVKGIAGADVGIFSRKAAVGTHAFTDANGYYEASGLDVSDDYLVYVHSDSMNTDFFYSIPEGEEVGVYVPTKSVFTLDIATRITPKDPMIPNIDIIVRAQAETAIEGHVYNESGKPLSGILVNAWSDGLNTGNGSQTDENGHYVIYGLVQVAAAEVQTKGYLVDVRPEDYVYQAYNKVTSKDKASLVATGSSGIDFYLKSGLSVSGQVKDANGQAASGIKITIWSDANPAQKQGTANTDSNGRYTIANLLPSSDYIASATAAGYPVQYYSLTSDKIKAQFIALTTDDMAGIDFTLDKGSVIRGAVFFGDSPAPGGVSVSVRSATQPVSADVLTDASGKYEFVGLDKSIFDYIISIRHPGYVPAYYAAAKTVYNSSDADRVAPMLSAQAPSCNFVLITGFKLFGSVTFNGAAISGIKLSARLESGGEWTIATTDAKTSTNYNMPGLLPGNYLLVVSSDDYIEQEKTFAIADKDLKYDISLTLLPPRSILGTVKGVASGKIVQISAWSASENLRKTVFVEGTGSPVQYTISDLKPASDYAVEMSSADYPYQIYNNKTRPDDADLLDITQKDASGIDFVIPTSLATISGDVVFPADATAGDTARIDIFSKSKGISVGADLQMASSNTVKYKITGLMPAADYIVYVSSSKYINYYYTGKDNGTPNQEAALRLDTTKTLDITANLRLIVGRNISGKISDESGRGKADILVEVWSETTGTSGSATSASDGTYSVKGLYSSPDFIVQARDPVKGIFFYNEKASVRNRIFAMPVSTMEKNASDINITLSLTESISGQVRNPAGQPLAKIWVEAWSELQQSGSGVFTDNSGNYQISGLSKSSDYKVIARPDWFSLPIEKYNIESNSTGVNFTLDPDQGYTIKGVVKNNKGVPVSRVRVELWSKSLDIRGDMWAVSDNAGLYELRGLPGASDYRMMIYPRDDSPYSFYAIENIALPLPDDTKDLEVSTGTKISGNVRLSDGTPMAGIQMVVIEPDGYFRKETETDKNGDYAIYNVPMESKDGGTPTYRITALTRDGIGQSKETKSAGEGIDFILEESGKITGQVRDQKSGNGLAGITVEAYSVSMFGVKNFGGTAVTDDSGKYVISGLKINDLKGVMLNDYQVTVNAPGYPPQSKGAKRADEEVNFNVSRGKENEISGTVTDADGKIPQGTSYVAEAYEQIGETKDGKFISSAIADSAGNFKFGTLIPEKKYFLKFTAYAGDTEVGSQWATAGSSPDFETGIDNPPTDEVPEGAKLYSTDTIVHFRFSVLKKRDNTYSGHQKPGAVLNLHSISHVGSNPINPKLRDNAASENIPVSNNPNITTAWEPPAAGLGLKYYVVFNTNEDFSINKRNAPESPPSVTTQATSQKLQGDDVKVYCHVAVVDDRGRIGATVTVAFRIDTVPPTNGTVNAPEKTSGDTISLTLGASGPGVREMYVSNTGYGQNGEWETRVKDKDWKVSQGDGNKDIYVQYRDEAKNVANYRTTTQKISEKPPEKPPEKPVTPATPGAAPVVDNQMFIVNITAPDGTVIGRIVVSASSPVTFVVISGNTGNVFIIDPDTGEIKVGNSKVLAQNGSAVYPMTVQISDGDKTTNATITVRAVDPGKDKLVLTDQAFTVDKHAEDGTYIGTVSVFTTEASTVLSYHILSGNEDNIFAISTKTGDIIVWDSRKLSESTADVYVLKVEVSDGKNTAIANITIKVKDFGSSVAVSDQNFGVNEDAAVGTLVGRVDAVSSDASAALSYRIVSGNDDGMFAIDSNGKLTLIGQLDYDRASSYSLAVEVSDGRSTASATILISVNAVSKETLKGTWHWERPDIRGASSAWLKNIAGVAPDGMFVVGGRFDYDASEYKNLIWRYSDGQWSEMATDSYEWLYDIWGRSGSDIFAVGWEGIILHYDGSRWTGMSSPTSGNLRAVFGDASSVIAVGEKGAMSVYDGSAWKSADAESSATLNSIWGKDGVFFIAGDGGIILRYDGGRITAENTGISENLYDIGGRSLSDIYAVGDKGTILHYDGKTWMIRRSGGTEKFNTVSVSEKHVFAAGDSGVVFHSSGRGWAQVPTGTQVNFRGIWAEGRSAFAVGDNGAILRFDIE